jgi:hypothetical protein
MHGENLWNWWSIKFAASLGMDGILYYARIIEKVKGKIEYW